MMLTNLVRRMYYPVGHIQALIRNSKNPPIKQKAMIDRYLANPDRFKTERGTSFYYPKVIKILESEVN